MRVLVTGGAGYVGSHIAKVLAGRGHTPVVVDDLRRGHRGAVRWGPLVEADVSDPVAVAAALAEHRPDAIVHCAAYAYVSESMTDPRAYFSNNVEGTLRLLDVMLADRPVPLVFSSTCATYGIPIRQPIDEDAPQRPVNPYGASKLMVESALGWYGRIYGLPWASLRYFNAAGADPDGEIGEVHDPEPHLIPRVAGVVSGRFDAVEVFGTDYETPDGSAVRDYVHVTDLAVAHLAAVERLVGGGSSVALNLGTGGGTSVFEVIAAMERASGRSIPVREAGRRRGDPPVLVADPTRARSQLQWEPRHSDIDTIARTALEWETR